EAVSIYNCYLSAQSAFTLPIGPATRVELERSLLKCHTWVRVHLLEAGVAVGAVLAGLGDSTEHSLRSRTGNGSTTVTGSSDEGARYHVHIDAAAAAERQTLDESVSNDTTHTAAIELTEESVQEQLKHLFDDAVKEMLAALQASTFQRFRASPEWSTLLQ